MAHDIQSSAKIFVPANDNPGGRHIVVMQPEHVVFPEWLRERLLMAEPHWPVPTAR
jgi:hypothetical protein